MTKPFPALAHTRGNVTQALIMATLTTLNSFDVFGIETENEPRQIIQATKSQVKSEVFNFQFQVESWVIDFFVESSCKSSKQSQSLNNLRPYFCHDENRQGGPKCRRMAGRITAHKEQASTNEHEGVR